jgi:hypothetical protein
MADEKPVQDQVQERWPSWMWALNIPGVGDFLKDPKIRDQSELESKIQGTDWYKQNSDAVRHWQAELATNPGTAAADIGKKAANVNDLFQSYGLTSNPDAQSELATQALKFQWNDNQLQDAIVQYGRTHPAAINASGPGLLQTTVGQLKQAANKFYVGLDDGTANSWAQQIVAGEKKPDDFTNVLQGWARNKFATSPDVINALNSGMSTEDYFAGYKSEAAKLLETDPNQIDLNNNPMFNKILTGGDPQGGTNRVMSMAQMNQYLRTTDQYNHTQGAINNVVDAWTQVGKLMGKQA